MFYFLRINIIFFKHFLFSQVRKSKLSNLYLLKNIFLFKGKNFNDLDQLNIYSYPSDILTMENSDEISKIIYGHDHGDLINKCKSNNLNHKKNSSTQQYLIDVPVPQKINALNIYTTCINGKIIIGLIFEEEDNPYDYKLIFEELLNELLNNENSCNFEDEIEIENLLITLFINIRKYDNNYIERYSHVKYNFSDSFFKVFLFGIDDVGKSSLIRRIKSDEYEDNFFLPTKKVHIEYIPIDKKGLLAFWDMPGQSSFRNKWLIGVQDSNVLLFMIDVANQIRFEESRKEFWNVINREEYADLPLIILCNKIDLIDFPNDTNSNQNYLKKLKSEIIDYFALNNLKKRDWKLIFTSVKNKFNINQVIDLIFEFI